MNGLAYLRAVGVTGRLARLLLQFSLAILFSHTSCAVAQNRVLELDGNGGYVELPPNLFTNQLVTIEGWMKWRELGVYGGGLLRGAPTPRIDRLAGEGMRLLNFNVEAQCTPSRSAPLFQVKLRTTRSAIDGDLAQAQCCARAANLGRFLGRDEIRAFS